MKNKLFDLEGSGKFICALMIFSICRLLKIQPEDLTREMQLEGENSSYVKLMLAEQQKISNPKIDELIDHLKNLRGIGSNPEEMEKNK